MRRTKSIIFVLKKATLIEREIEDYVRKCEQDKDKILEELNELIGSEEKKSY